jgi:septum formation protein
VIQRPEPRLVLASASAARRTVLAAAGLRFTAEAAAVDEAAIKESARAEGLSAGETAAMLAEAKASRVARRAAGDDALVIGADQILVCDGAWFDKPADMAAARAQLRALRGKTHALETALVCWRGGERVWGIVEAPRLTMRAFSDPFLDAYLEAEGEAALSSVGGYRLEGLGAHLFAAVAGDHAAVLGLPLLPLLGFLRGHGVLLG